MPSDLHRRSSRFCSLNSSFESGSGLEMKEVGVEAGEGEGISLSDMVASSLSMNSWSERNLEKS